MADEMVNTYMYIYYYVSYIIYKYVMKRPVTTVNGNTTVTVDIGTQWRRARDLTNLGVPQVPGSNPAENPSK